MMQLNEIPEVKLLMQYITEPLGVQSILCYGSFSAGLQDEHSDIDLLIFVKTLPTISQLTQIYNNIPNVKDIDLKNLTHLDPASWSLQNAKLSINGVAFDIGFNTISWAKKVVKLLLEENCINFKELSFRPYTFLGLLENANCLYDKNALIEQLRCKVRPFPHALKKEIVKSFLPMVRDCYEDMLDNYKRNLGILAYQFHVFMGIDAICQLLWVINDVYDPASKRTEVYLFKLKNLPAGFIDFINCTLPKSYENKEAFINEFYIIKLYLEKEITRLGLGL